MCATNHDSTVFNIPHPSASIDNSPRLLHESTARGGDSVLTHAGTVTDEAALPTPSGDTTLENTMDDWVEAVED